MRAVSRFGHLLLAGALALVPATAFAQEAPAPTTNTPAADTIGPKALENFSLNGTVTHPADRPVPVAPAPRQQRASEQSPATTATAAASPRESAAAPARAPRRTETASAATQPTQRVPEPVRQPPQASPSLADAATAPLPSASAPPPAATFAADPPTPGTLAPEHKFPLVPWLLAALALGAGGAFLFWRGRGREAFAGGPQIDAFVAPEAEPASRPSPSPPAPKPATPASLGIVSTRLRPWIDIGFHPVRCVVEADKVTVDFEIELFNSGSAPARAVLAEASLFNAGAEQDGQIAGFFQNPVGEGERIVVMPPMKRVQIRTQVFAPRDQVQAYEVGGRQVFVPLIAFNALYSWGGGEGQTSAAYLLGRETDGDKLGPFRLDLGPRIFRGIAARPLPAAVRQ